MAGSGKAPNKWAALATVCMALWVIALNTTAINTAIGAIADDLDLSTSMLSWSVNAYVLAAAAFVVIGGQIGDVIGRRNAFLVGIAVFALGSGLVAGSQGGAMLIGGRTCQGLGSAVMMPSTMAIISAVFPPEERGTALGVWGAVGGLGFAIGPLYGGFFSDELSWRGIFLSDFLWLGLGAYLTITVLKHLPHEPADTRIDKAGAPLLVVGLFSAVLGVQQAGTWGWTSPAILGSLAVAAVSLAAFWIVEHRVDQPMVHFELFRIGRFVAGNVATFVNAIGLFGILYFFNLWAQAPVLLDESAIGASLLLVPYGVAMFIFSFYGGRIADRVGYALPMTLGFLSMAGGYALLATVSESTTAGDLWPALTLGGVGVGVTFSTSSAAGMVAVPDESAGEASGVINMFRYMGGVFIVAVGTLLYVGAGTAALNGSLAAAGVDQQSEATLDAALTASAEDFDTIEQEQGTKTREAFEEGARKGITDGFRRTSVLSGAAALVAAVVSAVLLRRKVPAKRRVEAEAREEVAGLADPDPPRSR